MSRNVRRVNRRAVLLGTGSVLAGVAASAAGRPGGVAHAVNLVVLPGAEPDEFACRAVIHSPESELVEEAQGFVRSGGSITLRPAVVRPDGSKIEAVVEISADPSGRHARVTTQISDRGKVVRVKHSTLDLSRR